MTTGIYVINADGSLSGLEDHPYDSEEVLQELLARYPDLLAGDQVDPANPRRWLLVERESGLPDREEGSSRWSLDHLFLDQDGIPTLVEVKLGSNTQIRREVVGQMLDYAANAVAFVTADSIRNRLITRCAKAGLDADDLVRQLLGEDGDPNGFWQEVARNLQTGTLRLVFVADQIPPELRRIVEFLNERMNPTEVLAVELLRYGKGELKAVVPRVIGRTSEAESRKSGGTRVYRPWDEPTFLEALSAKVTSEEVAVVRRMLEWTRNNGCRFSFGSGTAFGGLQFPCLPGKSRDVYAANLWTYGTVEIPFDFLVNWAPFDAEELRQELFDRVDRVPGAHLDRTRFGKRPGFPLRLLCSEEGYRAFTDALGWFVERIRSGQGTKGIIDSRGDSFPSG